MPGPGSPKSALLLAAALALGPLPAAASEGGLMGPLAPAGGPVLTRVAFSGTLGHGSPIGLEADLAWAGSPFHAGGLVWDPAFGSGHAGSVWGGAAWPVGAKGRLMALGGATRYAQGGVGCPGMGGCPPLGTLGAFAGLAYRHQEGFLWLQLTPQLFTHLDGATAYPPWAMSGLPWVEMGVVVVPGLELTFRLGETLGTVALRP